MSKNKHASAKTKTKQNVTKRKRKKSSQPKPGKGDKQNTWANKKKAEQANKKKHFFFVCRIKNKRRSRRWVNYADASNGRYAWYKEANAEKIWNKAVAMNCEVMNSEAINYEMWQWQPVKGETERIHKARTTNISTNANTNTIPNTTLAPNPAPNPTNTIVPLSHPSTTTTTITPPLKASTNTTNTITIANPQHHF